jgi:hypothetical protein
MTSAEDLLGLSEDLTLEFKSRDVLEDLSKVGREVVGMLNAKGGEVCLGVREESGRAVAVEPIDDADLALRRLRDYLADSIEPRPGAEELTLEVLNWQRRPAILRIGIRPQSGFQPYALVKGTGRHYLKRFGDRLLPMSREDLVEGFARQRPVTQEAEREAAGRLKDKLGKAVTELAGEGPVEMLYLGLQPLKRLKLEIQDARFQELLRDPGASGNRPTGYHLIDSQWAPMLGAGWLGTGGKSDGWLRIYRDGGIGFRLRLSLLEREHRQANLSLGRAVPALSPAALLDYPASVFRVAAQAYKGALAGTDPVLADLVLSGVGGWVLGWGSHGSWDHRFRVFDTGKDFRLEDPLRMTFGEIEEAPDRCAFRLVRLLYEAFGFPDQAIPPEYDRKAGRLVLPE